ncbi:Maf family protein [Acidithiobacillus sp. AMEEHan]|uniref:Maf family protein n=1 Tax=Acidithiobacillus sp. AMEEHan TaxID=2994951 RepID=UPI0027E45887|nr:Maf family protein [Acidithiobacillus sp. AMEEHan]
MTSQLILASSSPYRRELLTRLRIPFDYHSPAIDEERRAEEAPEALVQRLAEEKARRVAEDHPGAWIIGADQVACCGEQILGKSGNAENARKQLIAMQGRTVTLLNGLCLLAPSGQARVELVPYRVDLRCLSPEEIDRYIEKEEPFDCAGSLRAEGLGICLIERMCGEDPNAIIGLPLIRLATMLREAGFSLP